jgi:hypothetical protein
VTVYRTTFDLPVYLERGREQIISCPVYDESSTLAAPDAADTVSVLRPDGTALVDAQTIAVVGSTATYTLTPAASETLAEGWQVVWNLTIGTDSQRAYKVDAALVRQVLHPMVTDAHLTQRHPELVDLYPEGSTSFDGAISAAWTSIQIRLLQSGRRPYLVLSPWSLHEPLILLSLGYVFRALSTYTVGGDRYSDLSATYLKAYEDAWAQVNLTYDSDGDGHPDEGEQGQSGHPVIFLSNSPRSAFWGDFDG